MGFWPCMNLRRSLSLLVGLTGCNGLGPPRLPGDSSATLWNASLPVLVDAGRDQHALAGAIACLDAQGSYHPLGKSFTLSWLQSAGEPVALTDDGCFVAPLTEQTLTFELTADDGVWTTTDAVTVWTRKSPNPVLERDEAGPRAGPDRFLEDDFTLTPGASDALDADPELDIKWERIAAAPAPQPTSGVQPRADAVIFRLDAARDERRSHPDYLLLWPVAARLAGRHAPTVTLTGPARVSPGEIIMLHARYELDGFAQALRWHWAQTFGEPILSDPGNQPTLTIRAPRRMQTLCFRVTARDSLLESAPAAWCVEIIAPGGESPPQAQLPARLTAYPGETLTLYPDAANVAPDAAFVWQQTIGPHVQLLTSEQGRTASFIAPEKLGSLAWMVFGRREALDGATVVVEVNVVPP